MSAFVPDPAEPDVYRGPRSICPHCGRPVDTLSDIDGHGIAPEEGSITICFRCSRICVVEGGHLRVPTDAERAEAEAEPNIRAAIANVRTYWAIYPSGERA